MLPLLPAPGPLYLLPLPGRCRGHSSPERALHEVSCPVSNMYVSVAIETIACALGPQLPMTSMCSSMNTLVTDTPRTPAVPLVLNNPMKQRKRDSRGVEWMQRVAT